MSKRERDNSTVANWQKNTQKSKKSVISQFRSKIVKDLDEVFNSILVLMEIGIFSKLFNVKKSFCSVGFKFEA